MIHGQYPHHDSRQKKTTQHKYWGKENSLIRKNQKDLPICSITPLFNLLALCNKLNLKSDLMECMFFCPRDEESGCILIYPCLSVRPSVRPFVRSSVLIQIHDLSGYLLLQFWSYSFNILHDVYTLNGGVHVNRIQIFFKYSQNDRQLDLVMFSYQLHKGKVVCPVNSSYSFRATALMFYRMFIHIMEVCMSRGF